jgi:hypothetical protein
LGGGGGGGGGGGAARDLAALADLELDTEKNQYETQQSAAPSEEKKQQEISDALKKLDDLARREEDLAQQQRNGQQSAEKKWQQEMLRREAEDLQRELERQMGRQGQQGQQQGQGSSASGQAGESSQQTADGRQQAAQQALERLRQANEDLQRAVSGNASAADSRRAADRLREASDLLGRMQQQDATGELNQLAQTAGQLTSRQKQQADRVRELMAQIGAARAAGKQPKFPSEQELDQMVNDRQRVSDDLAHLTQQMRNASRDLGSTQPQASGKLRSALQGLDENELGTRLQRSSDYLRSGQFSDPLETGLTGDLQKLQQQLSDAARSLGNAQHTSEDAAVNRAMDDLARLRDQLDQLGGRSNSQTGQGQAGQAGQPNQAGGLNRNGQAGQGGQTGGQQAGVAGPAGGPANGGRRFPLGAYNTDPRITGHAVAPQQGPNPADTQRDIDQGLNLLNGMRAVVQDSPEAQAQLQSLIDEMRNLDLRRFTANPTLMDKERQQLVSRVDALELQLRQQLDETHGGTIRNTDPNRVPPGYEDSVAEYYRKLSSAGR